jgi:hypothetical protein
VLRSGRGHESGAQRADIPFFGSHTAVTWTFLALAVVLLAGALTLAHRRLAMLLSAWLSAQLIHVGYHVYDMRIIAPAARLQLLGAFAASLVLAAGLVVLLLRGPRPAPDCPQR